MILYKNVDVCDLVSILQHGVLSMNASDNDNWLNNKRAKNSTNVVYLFKPIGFQNSFVQYGVVLIEVDVEAKKDEMLSNDSNIGKYEEFITDKVEPSQIKRIFIPKIFKGKINIASDVIDRITWCDIVAEEYDRYEDGVSFYKKITPDRMDLFANTAKIECSNCFNYFRGIDDDNTIIDVYNVVYKIDSGYDTSTSDKES